MSEKSLADMTLRDKFKTVGVMTRDLTEHLERNFLPKLQDLARISRTKSVQDVETGGVADASIRTHAAAVLDSEVYTAKLYAKVETYLDAIHAEVSGILNEE